MKKPMNSFASVFSLSLSAGTSTLMTALLLSSFACAPKTEIRAPEKPRQTEVGVDESVIKSFAEATKTMTKDLNKGGQPGLVQISGALVEEAGAAGTHISILQRTGRAKDGKTAELAENSLSLSKDLVEAQLEAINEAKKLRNIIYVGCGILEDTTALLPPGELQVQKLKALPQKQLIQLKAKIVFTCGEHVINDQILSLAVPRSQSPYSA